MKTRNQNVSSLVGGAHIYHLLRLEEAHSSSVLISAGGGLSVLTILFFFKTLISDLCIYTHMYYLPLCTWIAMGYGAF